MVDPILGGILGGVARIVPEVLKVWDRKNERSHELALGVQQLDLVKQQGNTKLAGDKIAADSAGLTAGLATIKSAYENMKSGIPWIDGVNQMVRPWITFIVFHAWLAVKAAAYVTMTNHGISWDVAAATLWTVDDQTLLSGIGTFYFLSRVFDKQK